ncbi:hypothetical protein LXL04_002547 [Taraxacum kok-saghyz]
MVNTASIKTPPSAIPTTTPVEIPDELSEDDEVAGGLLELLLGGGGDGVDLPEGDGGLFLEVGGAGGEGGEGEVLEGGGEEDVGGAGGETEGTAASGAGGEVVVGGEAAGGKGAGGEEAGVVGSGGDAAGGGEVVLTGGAVGAGDVTGGGEDIIKMNRTQDSLCSFDLKSGFGSLHMKSGLNANQGVQEKAGRPTWGFAFCYNEMKQIFVYARARHCTIWHRWHFEPDWPRVATSARKSVVDPAVTCGYDRVAAWNAGPTTNEAKSENFFVLYQNRSKTRIFFKFFYRSLYNTYLKSCTYAKVKKKYRFFGKFFQRIVMIKNVLEGSEVGFLKGITALDPVRRNFLVRSLNNPIGGNFRISSSSSRSKLFLMEFGKIIIIKRANLNQTSTDSQQS